MPAHLAGLVFADLVFRQKTASEAGTFTESTSQLGQLTTQDKEIVLKILIAKIFITSRDEAQNGWPLN